MSDNPDADRVFESFAEQLTVKAESEGWSLVRKASGNDDHSFLAVRDDAWVGFAVHLSQTPNGFWGLTPSKAEAILHSRREQLVLLRGPSNGYFVSNTAFQRLRPRLSVHKQTRALKINEGVVRGEPRFRDLDDLWALLAARSVAPAT